MRTSLRAFAIGVIFATGVMGVAYSIVSSSTLAEEDVQAFAKENNMRLLTNEEYQELLPSIEEPVKEKTEVTEKPEEKPQEKEEEKAEEEKKKPAEEEKKNEEEANASFNVKIPEGMATYEVSQLLEESGVIKDADEFDEYLEDLNLATRVRSGTFKMKKNMTYKEAANVLIR